MQKLTRLLKQPVYYIKLYILQQYNIKNIDISHARTPSFVVRYVYICNNSYKNNLITYVFLILNMK